MFLYSHSVPVASCQLPVASCQLPVASCQLPVTSCQHAKPPSILSRLNQRTSFIRLISADLINIRAIRRPRREAECAASSGAQVKNECHYISIVPQQFMKRWTVVAQLRGRQICYEVLRGSARCSVDPGHCNSRGRDHTAHCTAPLICTVCLSVVTVKVKVQFAPKQSTKAQRGVEI